MEIPTHLEVVFALLTLALVLATIRFVLGPTLADRVVALDLIAAIAVGLTIAYGLAADESVLVDAALVIALISFLGTVVVARCIEQRKDE